MKASLKQKPSPEKKKLENIEEGEEIKEEVKEVKEATPSSKYERSSSSDGDQGTNGNAKEEKKYLAREAAKFVLRSEPEHPKALYRLAQARDEMRRDVG